MIGFDPLYHVDLQRLGREHDPQRNSLPGGLSPAAVNEETGDRAPGWHGQARTCAAKEEQTAGPGNHYWSGNHYWYSGFHQPGRGSRKPHDGRHPAGFLGIRPGYNHGCRRGCLADRLAAIDPVWFDGGNNDPGGCSLFLEDRQDTADSYSHAGDDWDGQLLADSVPGTLPETGIE